MCLVGLLVYCIFFDEEQFFLGVFEKFLQNVDIIQEYLGFQEISNVLLSFVDDVEFDFLFVVVCCDFINEVVFLNIDLLIVLSFEDLNLLNFCKVF